MKTNLLLLTAFLLLGAFRGTAQDQNAADSLIALYKTASFEMDEKELLQQIASNEPDPETKLFYAEELIQKASRDSVAYFLYKGYLEKGNALWEKGDFPSAIESYFRSIDFARQSGDSLGVGKLSISIADTYSQIGNAGNAEVYYRKGIATLRKTGDSVSLATALLNAGDDALKNNRFERAIAFFEESGGIFKALDYGIGTAYNLGNLGMVYAEQGQDRRAEAYINEAIGLLEELEDFYPVTVYLTYMSDIYLRKSDFNSAVSYAERSLNLATEYGLKDQISEANLKLSQLYEYAGDAATSLKHFKDHVAYRDSVRNIAAVQEMADLRTDYEVSQKQIEVDLAEERRKNQRNISIATAIALILIALMATGLYRRNKFIKKTNRIIAAEKERSDKLLLNILPEKTADELKKHGKVKADRYESVTVLFTDFKGFTSFSENLNPELLVQSVDYYFSRFDAIMDKYGLEKIKTIGDAYMCAGGLPFPSEDHAEKMILAAREIVDFVRESKDQDTRNRASLDIRVGINTGPVVAGVVGTRKFSYDIWGDTVNVASRMESNSEPGRINISENTYKLVRDRFNCTYRGEIEVKNRGSMKMYFVDGEVGS